MPDDIDDRSPARRPATPEAGKRPKGWYVPHTLPHFDSPEAVQAITFRLADALPRDVAAARKDATVAAQRRRLAAALDAGYGACLLGDPAHAGIVEAALLHGAGTTYEMFAWVVMPNHVHALIAPNDGHRLADIVQAWKSWTAKAINRRRGAAGHVWQREHFDRYIRDERHFAATVAYIESNPVKAGLTSRPGAWRFGSAWEGARPARRDGETPSLREDSGGSASRAPGRRKPPLVSAGCDRIGRRAVVPATARRRS